MNTEFLSIKYPEAEVTANDLNIWISGNTRQYAEALKADGFRWAPKRRAWYQRTEAVLKLLAVPEVIYLPGRIEPEETQPVMIAGLLPAPEMNFEREFYKETMKIYQIMAEVDRIFYKTVKSWDRPFNVNFLNFLKKDVKKVIPDGYNFGIGCSNIYNVNRFSIEVRKPGPCYVSSCVEIMLPSKSRKLTAEEKNVMLNSIVEAGKRHVAQAEEYQNLYWNIPDISEKISNFESLINFLIKDFYNDPVMAKVDRERRYNSALSRFRVNHR